MKQKDIALIIVIAFFSGVVAILVSNLLIAGADNRKLKAEVVEPIVADFPAPPEKYFNNESIDPTQLIRISNNENETPFNAD